MTTDERDIDLPTDTVDPALACLTDDLTRAHCAYLPPARDAAIRQLLRQRAAERAGAATPTWHARLAVSRAPGALAGTGRRSAPSSRRALHTLVSLASLVLVLLGSLAGYLRLNTPAPVPAQVILQHAAAALPPATPAQVIHQVSTLSAASLPGARPMTRIVDQWTQLDAKGAILRQISTVTDRTGALMSRSLQTGQTVQEYVAADHSMHTRTLPPPLWSARQDGSATTSLWQLVQAAQHRPSRSVHLLPPRTLDGRRVDVVELKDFLLIGVSQAPGAPPLSDRASTILYVDARTSAIRGVDTRELLASGAVVTIARLRVTWDEAVPLAAVPADTFALDAPATARRLPAPPPFLPLLGLGVAQTSPQAVLLSGDTDGLRLQRVVAAVASPGDTVTSTYQAPAHGATPLLRALTITTSAAHPRPAGGGRAGLLGGAWVDDARTLTLSIAGQRTTARYGTSGSGAAAVRVLAYEHGGAAVLIRGTGLNTAEFFAAVGALVDARTHPALVARLQRELAGSVDPSGCALIPPAALPRLSNGLGDFRISLPITRACPPAAVH